MKIRKILITGAAGYLAGFIIERLRSKYELTLTDRIEPKSDFKDLPFMQADLTNYEEIEKACEGQDAVVHLVALVRERFDKPAWLFADVMVKGTWNVAEACAVRVGYKDLSTFQVSPPVVRLPGDELPYRVGAPFGFSSGGLYYALAKYLGEQVGEAYYQAHGLSVIHLRPGVIAGDGLEPRSQGTRQFRPS